MHAHHLPSQMLFIVSYCTSTEAELAPKHEVPPAEATALEALLRADNLLEKKNNLCKEEETMLEIQVFYYLCIMYSILNSLLYNKYKVCLLFCEQRLVLQTRACNLEV